MSKLFKAVLGVIVFINRLCSKGFVRFLNAVYGRDILHSVMSCCLLLLSPAVATLLAVLYFVMFTIVVFVFVCCCWFAGLLICLL